MGVTVVGRHGTMPDTISSVLPKLQLLGGLVRNCQEE
jgi:hypothetical protein